MTSIRRGNMGAVRLQVGDFITYMTVRDRYEPAAANGRYLIGGFGVVARCPTHEAAADWYRSHDLALPSNCLVDKNLPLDYTMTGGHYTNATKQLKALDALPTAEREQECTKHVRARNLHYQQKVAANSTFIISQPVKPNYTNPPLLTDEWLKKVLDKIPSTRTPGNITPDAFYRLMNLL